MKWIDTYIDGLIELCNSSDIYEIYNNFSININKLDKDSFILQGNDSVYIRDYFENELVFIRNDLSYKYTKFILAHELGHAMLHTEVNEAAYNSNLINKGKLEKQADYFALKLLNIKLDPIEFMDLSIEQIASSLELPSKCLELII